MIRALASTAVSVMLATALGVATAAGLAALRGGQFDAEFTNSLWIVGCLMLLLTIFSFSPSTRHAPGELGRAFLGGRYRGNDDRGGAGLSVILALSALVMFAVALLVG